MVEIAGPNKCQRLSCFLFICDLIKVCDKAKSRTEEKPIYLWNKYSIAISFILWLITFVLSIRDSVVNYDKKKRTDYKKID